MSGAWRVAARLAGRDLAEHRLRTGLTAGLVGLPVMFAAVLTALVGSGLGATDVWFAIAVYLPIGLLIVLLAVPAFGVTARTRRDQLALIESTGGSPADVRRVVAAGGLVTGLLGVVAALVLAVPLWFGATALINHLDPGQATVAEISDIVLWPVLAVFALGASTIAAVVTAFTVTSEPTGSSGAPRRGVLLAGLGIGVVGLMGVATTGADSIAIAPWTTVLGVGVVLIVPTIVHLVGRAASHLPIAARLSARDADRHRSRTAPAVAAVMVGVAAVTALGIGSSSDVEDRRTETDMYAMPVGAVTLHGLPQAIETAVTQAPGGLDLVPLTTPDDRSTYLSLPYIDAGGAYPSRDVVIADAETLAAWGVRLDPSARAALDAGTALVGPSVAVKDGRVSATEEQIDGDESTRRLVFPAVAAKLALERVPAGNRPLLARVVVPPELARQLDLRPTAVTAVVDRRGPAATDAQVAALRDLPGSSVDVQKTSYYDGYALVFSLLTLLGLGVVGLATATAVALARVDGREDSATLESVGAPPSTSRWAAASAALLIGGLGSLLGVAVGFLPGVRAGLALTGGYGERFLAIPWALLGTVGIVIPVLVAAMSFVTARPVRQGPTDLV